MTRRSRALAQVMRYLSHSELVGRATQPLMLPTEVGREQEPTSPAASGGPRQYRSRIPSEVMVTVPAPRAPRCLAHHVHLASCIDCQAQRKAERAAALARLERIRLEAGAL